MKKLSVVLTGLLLVGTTAVFAAPNAVATTGSVAAAPAASGGSVSVENIANTNTIVDADVVDSVVGIRITADGGDVAISNVANENIVENSAIENSTIGMNIRATNGGSVDVTNVANANTVQNSNIKNSTVGLVID
jgi:hypothetical protein